MKRFSIQTLGCKVNQCESAAIAYSLKESGLAESQGESEADLVVINTCAVTGKAAMQSRQAVRRAIRQNPNAGIVVTGCYAQIGSEDIRNIAGVDLIVGHEQKLATDRWLPLSREKHPEPFLKNDQSRAVPPFAPLCSAVGDHRTRAFLKIQDGCNTHCTYCIVPLARGSSRSMQVDDVKTHMKRLGEQAYREVVLTGIHLGAYGNDLTPRTALSDLLVELAARRFVDRIRLSSIEPTEIDSRVIDNMADTSSGLCRHFHIPLQSGDNSILRQMGRGYTRKQFEEVVRRIYHEIPGVAIGMDVLVGFPGEDDGAFDNTFNLIESLPVSYLHVFPFSPRPGTRAAGLKNQVPSQIIKNRCRRLHRLGSRIKKQFYTSQIGSYVNVLVETSGDKISGLPKGNSDNYLPVTIADGTAKKNCIVKVRIDELNEYGGLTGKVVR